ncbi:MAG: hypothetical protein IJZ20_03750, partial [Clostridia bacterium]|nr:hypothetical protein [Clostridia bacterium]
MKKTISIVLCVFMTLSLFVPSYALTLDTAETAVLSSEETVYPVSASGYDGKVSDVNPGYPGAYYTFDVPINTDTLTLENIANERVASFEYDEETNTIILFRSTDKILCGKTVSFSEWDSNVETVDGERLTFTALTYKIAEYFPNTGSNLIPYGDFEGGFSPAFYAEASETFTPGIAEEPDGNKFFHMDASKYSGALYPHAQIGFSFEEGNAYKFVYSIKHAGMSLDANGKTVANKNTNSVGSALFSGTQTGATTNRMIKHQHSFPNVKITYGDDFKKNEYVITVNENDGSYSPEAFSVYTNPQSKSTVCFMLDDIAVYQRCDLLFDAGDDCSLIDGASLPERVTGVFLDGSAEETSVVIPEMEIPFECNNEDWYIDAEKPWKDENGNEFAPGDTIDLADYNKTVTLIPNIKTDVVFYTVSFDGTGIRNAPSSITVREGTVLNLTNYYGVNASNTALRFNGWSLEKSDSLWDAVEEITVDSDITIYPIVSYDFNFAIPA